MSLSKRQVCDWRFDLIQCNRTNPLKRPMSAMRFPILAPASLAVLMLAAGCSTEKPVQRPAAPSTKSAALRNMEQVARAAHRCWFASKDAAFSQYSFANELNNFSGRPRFLLVPKGNYGGRPLLVVQAEGASGRVEIFGPLLTQQLGGRVQADIDRWKNGNTGCGSAA